MKLLKSILVTGGAGFIGSHFVRRITKNYPNTKIVNLDLLTYAADLQNLDDISNFPNYEFIYGDINNFNFLQDLFRSHNFDSVVHLAAESHVDNSIKDPFSFAQTNIQGTLNLLEAVRRHWGNNVQEKRFYHISTDEVFGSLTDEGKFSEKTAYDPRSPYSASKASSDHLANAWFHTYNFPIIKTNCSNNFGPYQFPEKLIPLIIIKALNNEIIPIYGDGENIRDWLYVEDHVDALILLSKLGKIGETYCIGGNGERSNNEVAYEICRILDKKFAAKSAHKEQIRYVLDRPGHDQRYAINFSKMKTQYGWEPKYNFNVGLSKTVDWYLENITWMEKKIKEN